MKCRLRRWDGKESNVEAPSSATDHDPVVDQAKIIVHFTSLNKDGGHVRRASITYQSQSKLEDASRHEMTIDDY